MVNHLEPWEKGSRKTAGQTGMCGGVRGVGAGGIVSSAYCLLYKLYTLKLTRKQLIGLCTHSDSPYIRALGLMYIRYTQPPADLWEWYEPYLDDEEQIDVKAGGGNMMTIGEISQQFLTKLEWYSTLFPRIPVPIEKQIEAHLSARRAKNWNKVAPRHLDAEPVQPEPRNEGDGLYGEAERALRRETSRDRRQLLPSRRPEAHDRERSDRERSRTNDERHSHGDSRRESYRRSRSRSRGRRSHSRNRHHSRSDDRYNHQRSRHRSQDRSPGRSHRHRSKDRKRSTSRSRKRSQSREDQSLKRLEDSGRHSSRTVEGSKRHHSAQQHSVSPYHHVSHGDAFDRDLRKELERVNVAKDTENGRKSTKTV